MPNLRSLINYPIYLKIEVKDKKRIPIGDPVALWHVLIAFSLFWIPAVSALALATLRISGPWAAFVLWLPVGPFGVHGLRRFLKLSFEKTAAYLDAFLYAWTAVGVAHIFVGAATYFRALQVEGAQNKDQSLPSLDALLSQWNPWIITILALLFYAAACGRVYICLVQALPRRNNAREKVLNASAAENGNVGSTVA